MNRVCVVACSRVIPAAPPCPTRFVHRALGNVRVATLLFALGLARPLQAQQRPLPALAPGFLPVSHWSRTALQRLTAAGLLRAADAALAWPLTPAFANTLFERAAADSLLPPGSGNAGAPPAARDADDDGTLRILARVYRDRLRREFLTYNVGGLRVAAALHASLDRTSNELFAGRTVPSPGGYDYAGPRARADSTNGRFGAALGVAAGPVAAEADLQQSRTGASVAGAALTAAIGRARLWVGRRPLSLGPSPAGGLVLGNAVAFDGGGLDVVDGFRLPGFLRALGPVRLAQLLARMQRSGDIVHPWFLAQRFSFAPAARVDIGINRAAIFGGRGNEGVTPTRIFWMLLGQTDVASKDSDFENQVASVDVVWQPPSRTPLLLHAEWGFDDAGAAFLIVPAIIAGVELAELPGARALGLGLEATHFTGNCCGYPPWYWHGELSEGWTDRGVLLGSALAGHGDEAAITWNLDIARATVIADGRLYTRHRNRENLYAPDRLGSSAGAELNLSAALSHRLRLETTTDAETARTWTRWTTTITTSFRF